MRVAAGSPLARFFFVVVSLLLAASAAAGPPPFPSPPPPAALQSDTTRPADTVQAPGPDAREPEAPVREQIDVREEEILVKLPPGVHGFQVEEEDLLVRVGGFASTPVKVAALAEGEAVTVLYFDLTAHQPESAALAALALAKRVERLTWLGTVEVVVADPEPRTLLEPTRDATGLVAKLAEVAKLARRAVRERYGTRRPTDDGAAWQRLRNWVLEQPRGGPRFLLLSLEPFPPDPREHSALQEGAPVAPTARVQRVLRCARTLAASGWVTVHLSLRPGELKRKQGERFYFDTLPEDLQRDYLDLTDVGWWLWRKVQGRSGKWRVEDPRQFVLATSVEGAAAVAVVRETGGEIVTYETVLAQALDELQDRVRVWYPVDAGPRGAVFEELGDVRRQLLPVDVLYLPDGRNLRTRRWTLAPEAEDGEGPPA